MDKNTDKTLRVRLAEIKLLCDDGVISHEEFDHQRKVLLAQWSENNKKAFLSRDQPKKTEYILAKGIEVGSSDARFQLQRLIGMGGFSQVWLAHDLIEESLMQHEGGEDKPLKALKFIHERFSENQAEVIELKKEASRASKLNHENIINVTRFVQGPDGWPFIVMEYLEGVDLHQYFKDKKDKCLSIEEAIHVLKPVAKGLDYAHEMGICHRDLKPANIFITNKGEIKILDFGLSYQIRRSSQVLNVDELTLKNTGTVEYMAPETFYFHEPRPSHDIYALAIVLYELLAGEPPFMSQKAPHRKEDDQLPPKPPKASAYVWEVIQEGFAWDPKKRPKTAMAFIKNVEQANITAKRLKNKEFQQRKKSKDQHLPVWLIPAAFVLFIGGIGIGLVGLVMDDDSDTGMPGRIIDTSEAVKVNPQPSLSEEVSQMLNKDNAEKRVMPVALPPSQKNEVDPSESVEGISLSEKDKRDSDAQGDTKLSSSKETNIKEASAAVAPVMPVNGYSIQLLVTTNQPKAERIMKQMIGEGYPAYIAPAMVNGNYYYRVRIGSYRDKSEAEGAQARMKRRYTKNQMIHDSKIYSN